MNWMKRSKRILLSILLLLTLITGLFVPSVSMPPVYAAEGTPDLTVTGISISEGVKAGQQISVTAAVYDAGDGETADGFTVTLSAKLGEGVYQEVQQQTVSDSVYAGDTVNVGFLWTPAGAGNYTLKVEADSGNTIAESDEANNFMETAVTVGAAGGWTDLSGIFDAYQDLGEIYDACLDSSGNMYLATMYKLFRLGAGQSSLEDLGEIPGSSVISDMIEVSGKIYIHRPQEGGTFIYNCDSGAFESQPIVRSEGEAVENLRYLWGTDISCFYGYGAKTSNQYYLYQYDQYSGCWREIPPVGSDAYWNIQSIWGDDAANVFICGRSGSLYRYDGKTWTKLSTGTSNNLWSVWGTSWNNVYIGGASGTLLHFDGQAVSAVNTGATSHIRGLWGTTASDIYFCTYEGKVLHYNGMEWSDISDPEVLDSSRLYYLDGTLNSNIYARTGYGTFKMFRYDGADWTQMDIPSRSSGLELFDRNGDAYLLDKSPKKLYRYSTGASLPDLTVEEIDVPSGIQLGSPADITVTIKNKGSADASGGFSLRLTGEDSDGRQQSVTAAVYEAVTAGSTLDIHLTWTPPEGAKFVKLHAKADSEGEVAECNEINNEKIRSVTLAGLTLSAAVPEGGGSIAVVPDKSSYGYMETVKITARPESGHMFSSWGGDLGGGSDTVILVMTSDMDITASFNEGDMDVGLSLLDPSSGNQSLGSLYYPGEKYKVQVRLKNNGQTVVEGVRVSFYGNGEKMDEAICSSLAAGQETVMSGYWIPTGGGDFELSAVAEFVGGEQDALPGDNQISVQLRVEPVDLLEIPFLRNAFYRTEVLEDGSFEHGAEINYMTGYSPTEMYGSTEHGLMYYEGAGIFKFYNDVETQNWKFSGAWKNESGKLCSIISREAEVYVAEYAEHDGVYSWDKVSGSEIDDVSNPNIRDVWVSPDRKVYAVEGSSRGDTRVISFDGSSWTQENVPLGAAEIWGAASNDIYATGQNGLYHYDGSAWSLVDSGNYTKIWGNSSSDIYRYNENSIMYYNGSTWTEITGPGWGIGSFGKSMSGELYAVCGGRLFRYQGGEWSLLYIPGSEGDIFHQIVSPIPGVLLVTGNKSLNMYYIGSTLTDIDYTPGPVGDNEPRPTTATATIRVEGYYGTILPKTAVTVNATTFDLNPYLGSPSGSSGTPSSGWGPDRLKYPTVAHTLVKALEDAGFNCKDHVNGLDLQDYGWSLYAAMIGGEREFDQGTNSGWYYYVNGKLPSYGCQAYSLKGGEDIVWSYVRDYTEVWYSFMTADKTAVEVGGSVSLGLKGYRSDMNQSGNTESLFDSLTLYVQKGDGEKTVCDEDVSNDDFECSGFDGDGNLIIRFKTPGKYTISADHAPGADIVRPSPIQITVEEEGATDTTAPDITVAGLTDGMTVTSAALSFTVTAADNRDGLVTPVVKLGETVLASGEGNSYTCTLAQGSNTITIEATDSSNNKAQKSYAIIYNMTEEDQTAPVITVTGLTDGMTVISDALNFTVTASDNKDGMVVPVVKMGETVLTPGEGSSYTCTLAEGSNNITIEATDTAGNKAQKNYTVTYAQSSELRQQVENAIDSAANLVMSNNNSMDWVTVGLARAGKEIPANYLASVAAALNNPDNHTLTFKTKPTEFERMTLGVLAAGGDPTNIGGYNMIKQIYNADLASQGINAVIFGLIAVDAGDYDVPSDARWTREEMISYILSKECSTGGWAMSESTGDPDISGMAMTALAPYYNQRADVKAAVDRAVDYLSGVQRADSGGFDSWGTINSESCAQVLMGLCTNGIDPAGEKFTKAGGNLVQALLSFKASDGGFKHIYSETSSNGMATEQALYALDQYIFYLDGEGSIYLWGDKEPAGTKTATVRVEGKNGVVLPDTQIQVTGDAGTPMVKDAVLKALQDTGTAYAESRTGFITIGNETANASNNEKWLCSVEDGQPVGDMTSREIHNYENVVVYLGKDTTDYVYAWLEIPRSSTGLNTSVFKPHEIEVCVGQEVRLTLNGHVFNSTESAYAISPVSGASVYVDDQEYTDEGSAVLTDASGKAAIKINTEGIHTVSVKKDGMRAAYFTVAVLPDSLPPTVTFSSHLPGKINQGAANTIKFFWVYPSDNNDAGKDVTMSVTLNGNALTPSQINSSNGARKFSNVTFDKYCNILAVTVTDTSGNTQTITQLVINLNKPDDMAPAITVTGLTDGMTVSNAMLAFTVAVNDEQGATVTPAVKLNGNALTAADDGISYTCTLAQGDNTITVEVSDTAGNTAQQSFSVKYIKQDEEPTDPGNEKELGVPVPIPDSGSLSFEGGIGINLGQNNIPDNATVTLVDVTGQSQYSPAQDTGLSVRGRIIDFNFENISITQPVTISLPAGEGTDTSKSSIYHFNGTGNAWEYQESTYASGKFAANVSSFSAYGVLTDTQAPGQCRITLEENESGKVTLGLSASDVSGIKRYEVYRDDVKLGETENSYYIDRTVTGGSTYSYKMKAIDNLGNTSDFSSALSVTVSTEVPVIPDNSKTVTIRVEGYDDTVVPRTRITTDNFDLTPYLGPASGSSATPSDGWGPDRLTEPTVAHALIKALEDEGINCTNHRSGLDLQDYGWSLYVAMIAGDREFDHKSTSGWMYRVDGWMPNYGCQAYELESGEDIVWYFGVYAWDTWYTTLSADKTSVKVGDSVTVTLKGAKTDLSAPSGSGTSKSDNIKNAIIYVDGAELKSGGDNVVTGTDGKAVLTFDSPGTYEISAERFTGEGFRDIVRPVPLKITVTGETVTIPTPSSSSGAAGVIQDILNENPSGAMVAEAVKAAAESLKNDLIKMSTAEDAKKLLENTASVAALLDKATGIISSDGDAQKTIDACMEIMNVLGGISTKASGEDDKKTIADASAKTITAVMNILVNISDKGKLEEIATGLIGSAASIMKVLDGQEVQTVQKSVSAIVHKALELIGKGTLTQDSIKSDANGVKAVIDAAAAVELAGRTATAMQNLEKKLADIGLEATAALKKEISIEVPSQGKNTIEATLPAELVKNLAAKSTDGLKIVTSAASFSIMPQTFGEAASGKDITLTAARVDSTQIPAGSDIPQGSVVISLEAKAGGEKIGNFAQPMEVSIPFEGSIQNKDTVTVFLLKDDGTVESVGGKYDPETKTVKFWANHFSKYFAKESVKQFEDMSNFIWAKDAVEILAGKGIIAGKSTRTFDPVTNITRAEFAALITRMLKYEADDNEVVPFKDVTPKSWYYKAVAAAYKNGLMSGISAEKFDPNADITRQEMATIIARILGKKGFKAGDTAQLDAFMDKADIPAWAKEAASMVVREGIITGTGDGRFAPGEKATRAQAAVMLNRLFNLLMQ